jgi:hypothetical protein
MVTLQHAQYPDTFRPDWVTRSRHLTAANAVRHVRRVYAGKRNWWFQVLQDGVEVYSGDHEIAGVPLPRECPFLALAKVALQGADNGR